MSNPVYLQGSIGAVYVSQTGHQHLRNIPPDDNIPTKINCPECEAYLVRDHGGVYSPEQVPLTDRQVAAQEKSTREGNAAVSEAAKVLAKNVTSVQSGMDTAAMAKMIEEAVEAEVARRTSELPAKRRPGRPRKEA
jgi:uncharacterized membrane protein